MERKIKQYDIWGTGIFPIKYKIGKKTKLYLNDEKKHKKLLSLQYNLNIGDNKRENTHVVQKYLICYIK
jgi:hypothetical protein